MTAGSPLHARHRHISQHCELPLLDTVVRRYPHIRKAIYLPDVYATIVLSGIVTSSTETPITTKLPVGFEIHLPYLTKDSNETLLLVAAGPNIPVNLILGLPFIKVTGMIADFIDNVCQANHLLCEPFPIDFRHATKSIPVLGNRNAAEHPVGFTHLDCCASTSRTHAALHLLIKTVLLLSPPVTCHPSGSLLDRDGCPSAVMQTLQTITNTRSWGT